MSPTAKIITVPVFPNHLTLPYKDDQPVRNNQESPQAAALTGSLGSILRARFPAGNYCIGCDMGIYFHLTQPPLKGCKAPDWYLVPNVPALLDGELRRSYVLWQELVAPWIVMEFTPTDSVEDWDRTPRTGKFWVYEQAIRVPYYAIFEWQTAKLEVYQLLNGLFQLLQPNERGRYLIEPLGVELGVWHGQLENMVSDWVRWFDTQGRLLPTPEELAARVQEENRELDTVHLELKRDYQQLEEDHERLEKEKKLAEEEKERLAKEKTRVEEERDRFHQLLRANGIDPATGQPVAPSANGGR